MFEIDINSLLSVFKYGVIAFAILFCIAILFRKIKIGVYIFFLAFYLGLIWSLFTGTGSIHCICDRQINNVVTCHKTRYLFYGLFKEEQIISPLNGTEVKYYSEHTEIHLKSQGKTYLLNTGLSYSPFQLSPVNSITEDIEELISGKGNPTRSYQDGGIIVSIIATLGIAFLMLIVGMLFLFWVRPTFRDIPWFI